MHRGIAIAAVGALVSLIYWVSRPPAVDRSREYLVGTDNAYPYHAVDASGAPSGFAVEMLNEAAKRQGIRLRWVRTKQRAVPALQAGEVDLWPALSGDVKQMDPAIHLTEPWIHNDFAFVALRDEFRNLDNALRVKRVAIRSQMNARKLAAVNFPSAELLVVDDRGAAVEKVCTGEVDGAVLELRSAYAFMAAPPAACHGRPPCFVGLTFRGEQLSTAARPGMEAVADLLRAEIDRMGEDGTMRQLLLPWSYFQSNEVTNLYDEKRLTRALRTMTILFGIALVLFAGIATEYILLRRAVRARDSANEESWAKSRFMSKMSHELRTPLNGIVVGAELLNTTPLRPEQAEYVGIIRNSGETMLRLVQDLLDLSKVVNEPLPLDKQTFEITAWLESAVLPYAHQAAAKGLAFHKASGAGLFSGAVEGDPVRLNQVLANLLSNALKFTAEGGITVEYSTTMAEGQLWLHIAVADTGRGIAEDRLKDIFDASAGRPLFDDPAAGLGLGLSISAELVRQMGGVIRADSILEKGSRFEFRVPLRTVAVSSY